MGTIEASGRNAIGLEDKPLAWHCNEPLGFSTQTGNLIWAENTGQHDEAVAAEPLQLIRRQIHPFSPALCEQLRSRLPNASTENASR